MKYIGIDYGTKNIGVAVSDDNGTMAFTRFYSHFGIEAGPDLWLESLKSIFATTGAEVLVFNWSGGTS